VAVTYLNDKAKPHVEPLAREIEAPIFLPLDMAVDGQVEAVFGEIARTCGEMDFLILSIAFVPKDTLVGHVTDAPRAGFLRTIDLPPGRPSLITRVRWVVCGVSAHGTDWGD
jgi:enoyl-[acyl-carrier protein] reductase I